VAQAGHHATKVQLGKKCTLIDGLVHPHPQHRGVDYQRAHAALTQRMKGGHTCATQHDGLARNFRTVASIAASLPADVERIVAQQPAALHELRQ